MYRTALRGTSKLLLGGYGLFAVGVAAGGLLLLPASFRPRPFQAYPEIPRALGFAIIWLVALSIVVISLIRFRPIRLGISMAAATYMLQLYAFVWALPDLDVYRTQKPFAEATLAQVGEKDWGRIGLYRTKEIAYYLGTNAPIPEYNKPDELQCALEEGKVRWLILRRRDLISLAEYVEVEEILAEPVYSWESREHTETKLVLVRIKLPRA